MKIPFLTNLRHRNFRKIPVDVNKQYRQFFLPADINQTRLGILLLAIPNVSYVFNDYQFLHESLPFFGYLAMRLFILAFTVWLYFYFGKIKQYHSYDKTVFIYAIVLTIAVLSNFTRPQNALAQAVAVSVGVGITYLIINTRFAFQFVIASLITAEQLAVLLLNAQLFALTSLYTASLSMLFANLISAVASWQLHTYRWRLFQDMNERKKAERLVAIGETVGMVGHDLRNPLQATIGELFLAKEELEKLPESQIKTNLRESTNAIEDQAYYMDKIISDLQTFVKPVEVHKQPIALKNLLNSTLSQIKIPENIQTKIIFNDELTLYADQQLLKRVLINLITNAVQAMPAGGELTLEVQTTEGNNVRLDVEDTGLGIPEEIKDKIFQPLFTTKSTGQGFGLAVCKRIIEAHGGTITFDSQVDKGTRFTLIFPSKPKP